ncbi:hypothetical protein HID58_089508 [Brassica napus]|uniref:Cytochrome b5 heme-binding domain-containing protein n=2 Tax=Brassica napus TaxID=3708 RepID=A0ABQ7XZ87_BRANA|nr:hypothetical protein HID58_089508 [Brassica napus]
MSYPMQTKGNRALSSVSTLLLSILFFISKPSNAQSSSPKFACDVTKNPSLTGYGFCNTGLNAEARVTDLVGRLTLEEKIGFLVSKATGVSRLGIPDYNWWSEALHGVSDVGGGSNFTGPVPGATSFPQVILTAASFNVSLFQAIGKVVSTEARAMYNVGAAGLTFWSPNVNIFRDPRWGRGQETPGEDPTLVSKYAVAYVKGLQGTDGGDPNLLKVAACCKHYTAYDVDNWKGVHRYTFNSVVNQQDMDDTFQPPFKSCVVDGNVASVMCSYNQVNGKPTCADPDLLSGVIRGQWKLNGYIVSDCDSVEVIYASQHYTKTPEEAVAKSMLAGLDLNCDHFTGQHAMSAVKAGLVNETDVDTAISNNFATLMRLGFFNGDPKKQPYGNLGPQDVCTAENQELAREAARQGIVLLKNSPGSLPFSPFAIKTLAVIGPNANVTDTMIGNYHGVPCKYTTPLQGLVETVWAKYQMACPNVACTEADIDSATSLAASADAVVLVMGTDLSIEREDHDRVDLFLPGKQQQLVTEVAKVAKGPVVLVIMSGGGLDVTFAKNDPKITSIMWVGFPGQAGGLAIADVIFGRHNPSGKLPMTWYPQSYVENLPMSNMNMRADNSTGYPGRSYRFYTGETVYAFGDGISYTHFNHRLIKPQRLVSLGLAKSHPCRTSKCQSVDATGPYCGKTIEVELRVRNAGEREGTDTVFLFTTPPAVHRSPVKHLLAFEKVGLGKKEKAVVRFNVDVCKDLSVVDETGKSKIALGLNMDTTKDDDFTFSKVCPVLKAVQPDSEVVLEAKDLASHVDSIVLKENTVGSLSFTVTDSSSEILKARKPITRTKVPFEKGYSQMDWLKLTRTHPDLAGLKGESNRRLISMDEVKKHKSGDSMWTVLKGRVYNISPYMNFHPGGVDMLMKAVGRDGTLLFNKYHAWVNFDVLLEKCLVGVLDDSKSKTKKEKTRMEFRGDASQRIAMISAHLQPSFTSQMEEKNSVMGRENCRGKGGKAGFKVAILGAAGGIGQSLSLLMKMNPLVSLLHLYDVVNAPGVTADVSHMDTGAVVRGFLGAKQLEDALTGMDLVIIPAGVPRKPGMTRDDLFKINAGIVKTLCEGVAKCCPNAIVNLISNPVNSTVAIAAEVFKKAGTYDPKKLLGVTTLDVARANTFVAEVLGLDPREVDVPVVGGHAGVTILPLLSQVKPPSSFTPSETEYLTNRIQNGGTEVVEAKAGAGSATLSMAYAAAKFADACLRGLRGDANVVECSFVASQVTELPFFATKVRLGRTGAEEVYQLGPLNEYERVGLEKAKEELAGSIQKGVDFIRK